MKFIGAEPEPGAKPRHAEPRGRRGIALAAHPAAEPRRSLRIFQLHSSDKDRFTNPIGKLSSRIASGMQAANIFVACFCLCVAPFTSACAQQRKRTVDAATTKSETEATVVQNSELVRFPSPEVEFIVGPQLKAGSRLNPVPWFDQNAFDRGLSLCAAFPDEAHTPGNVTVSGTVSVSKGSQTVTGNGTHFRTEVKDYAIISNGSKGRIVKIVGSVQSDTQLTLTQPWTGETLAGQKLYSAVAQEVDNYTGYLNYYDFALTQYTNYYRTGDQRFLACARKVADSWWSQPVIDNGKNFAFEGGEGLAPRSVALNGLILRALDGRPEMWPWITAYVNQQFNLWDEQRVTYPGFYFGIRDGGFMLLYAAVLGAVHPNAATRADFKVRSLKVAKDYYARLQQPNGSYTWNDDDFPFAGVEQPFQVGILNEAMVAVHRLTGDEKIKNGIIKSAQHEYQFSYSKNGWRAMYYFVHGTMGKSPVVNCERGCGNAANAFPPADPSQIIEARQLNATGIHVFGYAYLLSGDAKFKTWGDEIFDSTYSGRDGYRGLAAARGKEYDESYRSSGKYLAWRLAHGGEVATSQEAAPKTVTPPVETSSPARAQSPSPAAETNGGPRELVATALDDAVRLSTANSITGAELQTLLDEIKSAYSSVANGGSQVLNATEVLKELKAAEEHALSVVLIIKSQNGLSENSRLRLGWTAARLKRAANGLTP